MCCRKDKPSGEAEGAYAYKTDDPVLQMAMQTPKGPRVGTYVICSACADSLPGDVIYEMVTAEFAKAGLFGRNMAATSSNSDSGRTEVTESRSSELRILQENLARLQEENQRLREELCALKSKRLRK
jgi:hypothetical protein